jgi:hypothetical protein
MANTVPMKTYRIWCRYNDRTQLGLVGINRFGDVTNISAEKLIAAGLNPDEFSQLYVWDIQTQSDKLAHEIFDHVIAHTSRGSWPTLAAVRRVAPRIAQHIHRIRIDGLKSAIWLVMQRLGFHARDPQVVQLRGYRRRNYYAWR